ncbi:GNAT family N-acetyltransferase [Xenorhabdus sp. XENO-1]|nr:GNAT family N-acetyltransferase [Xenorhabdus bovienii subsp. africana]
MRNDEFDFWAERSLEDYAEDLMENHLYSRKKAVTEALHSFRTTLSEGINTPNQYFRIYELESQAVGYIWFSLEDKCAFLSDIMLLPEFQGKGIGKHFIRAFIDEMVTEKALELELRVSPSNHRAISLYKELGFRITGFDMSLLIRQNRS